jgi:hypothetical protein
VDARGEKRVRSAADLVPVVAVAACLEETGLGAARPGIRVAVLLHVGDPAFRDDLTAVDAAAIDQHLAERQQIMRPAGDAAGSARRAFGINGDEGIGRCAERLPEKPGAQVRETLAADPFQHDAEHVRVGREIGVVAAMVSRGLSQAAQEGKHGLVAAFRRWGIPGHGATVAGIVQLGEIGFVKVETDAHVEQMLYGRVGIGAVARLGHKLADRRGRVEQALVLKNARDQRGDRLGDREHQMRIAAIDAVRVPFADQATVP